MPPHAGGPAGRPLASARTAWARRRLCAGFVAAAAAVPAAVPAQTDPSGAWRTWRTEHFRVHARLEHRDFALRAAREAEFAFAKLSAELIPPRGTIDLTLHDNVDFANGFASVFPSNRITLYLAAPATDVSLGRYDDWLRLVVTHELTHIFHLDRSTGVWGVAQRVFGRAPGLFPNTYRPSWVSEGLATYYESRLTTGGRVRGAYHTQLLAAAREGGAWPGPNDATLVSPRWPGGTRPYAWGSRFFAAAAAERGDSVIPRFVARTSRHVWPLAISAPLRAAGGESLEDGWRRMRLGASAAPPGGGDSVLARGLVTEPDLQMTADGRLVAFVRDDGRGVPRSSVRRADDWSGVAEHTVTAGAELAWLGDTLLVSQLDYASPVEVRSDLYRWTPGGEWRRLTDGARYASPFAAPDGRIGAVSVGAGARIVVTLSADGAEAAPLEMPPATAWGRLALSPTGAWLAGIRHHAGRWDVAVWPVRDPAAVRSVTNDADLEGDPSWSPDGATLLFFSERGGLPQAYAYRQASGTTERVSDAPTGARSPRLDRLGRLYYTTVLADGFAIVRRDPGLAPLEAGDGTVPTAPPPPPAVPVVEEAGYRAWPGLRPSYWIPFFHDERSAGKFFGAQTTGSDAVRRTSYAVEAGVAPGTQRWEGGVVVQHTRWPAAALDGALEQGWFYGGTAEGESGAPVALAQRERRLQAGVGWRWRRWRRSASVRLGGEVVQHAYFNDGAEPLRRGFANPTWAGGILSAAAGRVERPRFSVSSENGVSVSGFYRRRVQVAGPLRVVTGPLGESSQRRTAYEARGSVNGYLALPLPGFARWVLAARATAGWSGGTNAFLYTLGGESSGTLELAPGVVIGGGRRAFPLRSYAPGDSLFTRVTVATAELRIPLLLVGRGVWRVPVGVDRISLNVFAEAGGGWSRGEPARIAPYRGVGTEGVFDLSYGFDVPLRLRVGAGAPLRDGLRTSAGDVRYYFAIGSVF